MLTPGVQRRGLGQAGRPGGGGAASRTGATPTGTSTPAGGSPALRQLTLLQRAQQKSQVQASSRPQQTLTMPTTTQTTPAATPVTTITNVSASLPAGSYSYTCPTGYDYDAASGQCVAVSGTRGTTSDTWIWIAIGVGVLVLVMIAAKR